MENSQVLTTSATESVMKGITITFLSESTKILFDLRWMIILALLLILGDLWFGLSASKIKGEEIRRSRAGRRTLNKIIDYTCYVLIGAAMGKALGDPFGLDPIVIAILVMILCYCFEIDSIYSHICTIHHIEKRYSIWKIFWLLFTLKFKSVGEAFKEMNQQAKSKDKQL